MQEIYLNSLNRKINYPLWNNDLEHKDLEIIKQTLYDAYFESNLKNYCEEAAFIFAEWWKNHYAGEEFSASTIVHILVNPVIEVSFEPFFLHKNALTSLRN